MKIKKLLFSSFIVCLVCLLILGGVYSGVRKRPIEAREMSHAEIIEYEEDEKLETEDVNENVETSADVAMDDKNEEVEKISICVFGNSKISLSPDKAKICAMIENFDGDMVKAKQDNFEIFEKVISALKEIGISEEDIVLDNFNCYPQHECGHGHKILGYESTTRFSVNVSALDKIKECVSVLTENGVTDICNINYKVTNIDEEYNNALLSAVENAKIKATKILGRDDLQMVKVKEEYVYSCNNLYRNYADDLSASDLVGKVEIEAQVLVEFN